MDADIDYRLAAGGGIVMYWWQIVSDHDAWDWQQSVCVIDGVIVEVG